MSKPINKGRALGSSDGIEDAQEALMITGFAWLMFVGSHEKATNIRSHLTPKEALMLRGWVENGHFQEMISGHLKDCYNV